MITMPSGTREFHQSGNYRMLAEASLAVVRQYGKENLKRMFTEISTFMIDLPHLRNTIKSVDLLYRKTVDELNSNIETTEGRRLFLTQAEKRLEEKKQDLVSIAEVRCTLTGEEIVDLLDGTISSTT